MPSPRRDRIPWDALRVRLTLWNTGVVLAMMAAAFVAVRFGAKAALTREADGVLRGEMNEISLAMRDLHPDTDAVVAELRRKAMSHESRGWFTQILTAEGSTLWRSELCPDVVADFAPVATDQPEIVMQVGGYRYLRRRLQRPNDEPLLIRIGMSTESTDSSAGAIAQLLVPVGILLTLLTPIVGYLLAVRATKPVGDLLRTAKNLRPTRLEDRLVVRGTGDELDRLATTINSLLDQVAAHVEDQERFVADAAHELRGPLAAARSTIEVALSNDRAPAEYRETLAEVLDETDQLSKLANDLLLLAEASNPSAAARLTTVDLADLARTSVSMFAAVAEDCGVTIISKLPTSLPITGDAMKLRRLLGNLLDNAVRFTPAGGRVTLALERHAAAGAAILSISDTGCGIGPADLPRIFDRFYKADASRSRDERGRSGGLGLAICRSIVESHAGSMHIESEPGRGTQVTCRFADRHPRAPEPPILPPSPPPAIAAAVHP